MSTHQRTPAPSRADVSDRRIRAPINGKIRAQSSAMLHKPRRGDSRLKWLRSARWLLVSFGSVDKGVTMPIQLLFLDMEGTLLVAQDVVVGPDHAHHTSLWTRIFSELGPAAQSDNVAMIEKWDGGGYRSYMDWVDDSLLAMRRRGLTQRRFEALIDETAYNPGVPETLRQVHERGIRTAIVSGGFIAQARRAQTDLRIHHAYAAADLFWDSRGELIHWNIYPSDFEGKIDFVRLMMREYRFDREESAFIGDGANDVPITTAVGTSVAYNGHPALRGVAQHAISHFEELLAII